MCSLDLAQTRARPPERALIQLREGRFTSNVAVPDVGELSLDEACWLTDHGILPGVARLDDKVAGMVAILSDSSGYQISTGFTDR